MTDFEGMLQAIYESILSPGDVAIDVGAHIGSHTIPIARAVGVAGRVLAFEPLPDMAVQIENALRYGHPELAARVTVHTNAISDFEGPSEFVHVVDAKWNSGLRERTYDGEPQKEIISVQVRRLDSLIGSLERVDYIKIDVEGGELGVMRGAAELIRTFRPVISFEFGEASFWAYAITPGDVADFLNAQDYELYDILGQRLEKEAFTLSSTQQNLWDYLAFPREKSALAQRAFAARAAAGEGTA